MTSTILQTDAMCPSWDGSMLMGNSCSCWYARHADRGGIRRELRGHAVRARNRLQCWDHPIHHPPHRDMMVASGPEMPVEMP